MTLHLGYRPPGVQVDLTPGVAFVDQVELQFPLGTPMDWPVGTTAWLRVFKPGTLFDTVWSASVVGAVMSWNIAASLVNLVPRNARVELWLDYTDTEPFVWLEGSVVHDSCTAGGSMFGLGIAVPGLGDDGHVAVPQPGPPGPGGGSGNFFYFTQNSPASQWTIPHSLNRQIVGADVRSLDLLTEYSNVFVEILSADLCRLWVSPPIAGIARIF